jgi:hypothetical protein
MLVTGCFATDFPFFLPSAFLFFVLSLSNDTANDDKKTLVATALTKRPPLHHWKNE